MNDLLTIACEVVIELFRSDVDGHVPNPVYSWLATTGAHFGIGMVVALTRARKFAARLLAPFIVKELAFDLRLDGFALLTLADSAVDTIVVSLGYLWASWATGRRFVGHASLSKALASWNFR